jgi:hypothetical protein
VTLCRPYTMPRKLVRRRMSLMSIPLNMGRISEYSQSMDISKLTGCLLPRLQLCTFKMIGPRRPSWKITFIAGPDSWILIVLLDIQKLPERSGSNVLLTWRGNIITWYALRCVERGLSFRM